MEKRVGIEEIGERLRLNNGPLVDSVLEYSKQFWNECQGHRKAAEDKAQKIMTLAAACLAFLCTYGTFLAGLVKPFPHPVPFLIVFAAAALTLIASIALNVVGIRRAGYAVLSAAELTNAPVLQDADTKGPEGVTRYKRLVARHLLSIGNSMLTQSEVRHRHLDHAENLFVIGLHLAALCTGVGWVIAF